MWKNILICGIVLVLIGVGFVPIIRSDVIYSKVGNTLYVGGSGPSNYSTIQSAINNANTGDTVFVYNGTYSENVVVDKTINLTGEDRNSTIIDGGTNDVVFYISADWVNATDSYDSVSEWFTFTTKTTLVEINSTFNNTADSASIGAYSIEGNMINFSLLEDPAENYYYWMNFKVRNVSGKTITFNILNADEVPFLARTSTNNQIVYSYDDENWSRITTRSYSNPIYTFTQTFTSNEAQIATLFPFSYTDMQNYLNSVNSSQYVTKTTLGLSTGGRNVDYIKLTNHSIPDVDKKHVFITSRQHAAELTASYIIKGIVDFLISEDTAALNIRDTIVFHIAPMLNTDGVYDGLSRTDIDGTNLNREWDSSVSTEVNVVRDKINETDDNYGVDIFLDCHSQMNDLSDSFIYSYTSTDAYNFFDNLSKWTDFDDNRPGPIGDLGVAKNYGLNRGILSFTVEPSPHYASWTIEKMEREGKNMSKAIYEYFGSSMPMSVLLNDSELNDSTDSADLRANSNSQDWYESRNDDPTLLTLNISDVGGNSGKKAALKNHGISSNAYLAQEFGFAQTGLFNVSMDVYIDRIEDNGGYDRSCLIYIGDDSVSSGNPPMGTSNERFVFLTFYDSSPGDTGDDLEIRARTLSSQAYETTSEWTTVASDLSYDSWYTLRIECSISGGTYDVYVNDVLEGDDISKFEGYTSSSVTHISFVADSDGRGDFFVDNVFAPVVERYTLDVLIVGNGSVDIDPSESTYANGTVVELTATADSGWTFVGWSGDLGGSTNPNNIIMDNDKSVTCTFSVSGDVDPPEIDNVLATPSSTSQGGYMNISCDVTDNVGVDTVKINITGPGGFTPVNVTMNEGSYYYNSTYNIVGTYNFLIWANDTSDNRNMSTGHTLTITSDEYRISLNSSWNIISMPINESFDKTDIIVSYNGSDYTWNDAVSSSIILGFVYGYNRTSNNYETYDVLNPGYGYWMFAYNNSELVISGNASDDNYITSLKQDWSIMGLPYNQSLAKEDLIIHYSGTDYNWTEATTGPDPIMLGFIYGWNRNTQSYILSDTFDPGYGYWMYAYYNCTLLRAET